MDNGQADTGPETLDSLAQFLEDNPEALAEEEDEQNSEESEQSDSSEESEEDQSAEDESEEDESEEPEKPAPDQKFQVTVKGEDGADQTLEVDQKELIAGYQRHADYTRKTQELAGKEREAVQVFSNKLEESRSHYLEQAQLARAAVVHLAGLRSSEELAVLAQTDPSAWVQERQRAEAIRGVLTQLEQGMQAEQAKAQQLQEQQRRERHSSAWEALQKDGIDRPTLQKVFSTVTSKYGLTAEQMAGVDDPRVVRMMKDAAAYHDLQAKKTEVTKKAKEAPRLPPPKQSVPRSEQIDKRMNTRFRSGKANVDDLAAFIQRNKL